MLFDLGVSDAIRTQFDELFDAHEKNICVGEDINIFVNKARTKLGIKFPSNYDMTVDFVKRFEKIFQHLNILINYYIILN